MPFSDKLYWQSVTTNFNKSQSGRVSKTIGYLKQDSFSWPLNFFLMFKDIFVTVDVNMQKCRIVYILIISVNINLKCMNKIKKIMTVIRYEKYKHVLTGVKSKPFLSPARHASGRL